MIKLFIDDIRDAPEGWTLCRTITESIRFICNYGQSIDEISLDHDISHEIVVDGAYRPFPSPETYQAVAHYIAAFYGNEMIQPKITIHSANPIGAKEMHCMLIQAGFDCEIRAFEPATRNKKYKA